MKSRERRRLQREKTQERLRILHKQKSYFIYDGGSHFKITYISGCRKLAKKLTNKKQRQDKVGIVSQHGGYRKYVDYRSIIF